MKEHYSEADLLETYYTQPGQSMPVMMHLASCSECAARYERLDRKLREAAACHTDEKPETFWSRQRLSIMRRVGERRAAGGVRVWRVAAAAMLSFFLGGAVVYETAVPKAPAPRPAAASPSVAAPPLPAPHDAWESDELRDFHNMVEWESWTK